MRPIGSKDNNKRRRWTYSEELLFQQQYHLYSNKELSKRFNKSKSAIKKKASDLGLIKIGCIKLCYLDTVDTLDIICGIYVIYNIINNRMYIGCSENIKQEIKNHIGKLNCNNGITKDLQHDWLINPSVFRFAIVKVCNSSILHKVEEAYLRGLPKEVLYNKTKQHVLKPYMFDSKFITKFWDNIDKTNSCWNWNGHINQHGYGDIHHCNISYQAHRLAYYFYFNIDPHGYHILHTCDNRKCCNPSHLFLGTAADNVRDTIKKNRRTRLTSKFSIEDAKKMHEMQKKGMTTRIIGKIMKTSCANVCNILNGKIMLSDGVYYSKTKMLP